MRLFDKTLKGLDSYIDDRSIIKGFANENADHFSKYDLHEQSNIQSKNDLIIKFNEEDLKRYISPSPLRFKEISIGDHPDFKHLDHNSTEHHYAVSLFMDIKGSTRLVEVVQDLEELRRLKDTILTLAIHVCNYFGGHVQRLQGDGIFVLFTRKRSHQNDAIIGALNASSILTYFVKNELAPEIDRMGIEKPLKIRTGIDYGPNKDVLWSRYGIPGCNELTTTSTHTDLAAKLQSKASANGIMIGNNIRMALDLENCLGVRTFHKDGELCNDEYYHISTSNKYPMWKFDWKKYLLSYSCCVSDGDDISFVKPEKRIRCIREDTNLEYTENSYALPKGIEVRFELTDRYGGILNNYPKQKIKWEIINTGSEARDNEALKIEIPDKINGSNVIVTVNTKFLGQHKMRCVIGSGTDVSKLEFSVFVQSSINQLSQ